VLTSGRAASAATVPVELHAKLTEIGTLEIWCSEAGGQRTWRLQFDVRAASQAGAARHAGAAERQGVVDEQTLAAGRALIRAAFRKGAAADGKGRRRAGRAGETAGAGDRAVRWEWPASLARGFWETLHELEPARRLSPEHEARWLSLAGFALRPGYGLAVDDWRVGQTWKLAAQGLAFPKHEQNRAEWWVLWRRLAGGLTAGQQAAVADPLVADWRTYLRKQGVGVRGRQAAFQFGPAESAEVWRLLGSLELLRPATKLELGAMLLDRLPREKAGQARDAILFALGRVGARVPVYGPLNAMVDPAAAEQWARGWSRSTHPTRRRRSPPCSWRGGPATAGATCRTRRGRKSRVGWGRRGAPDHLVELVREGGTLREEEQRDVMGESLPRGLRIE
jgi:hypothetical protein